MDDILSKNNESAKKWRENQHMIKYRMIKLTVFWHLQKITNFKFFSEKLKNDTTQKGEKDQIKPK